MNFKQYLLDDEGRRVSRESGTPKDPTPGKSGDAKSPENNGLYFQLNKYIGGEPENPGPFKDSAFYNDVLKMITGSGWNVADVLGDWQSTYGKIEHDPSIAEDEPTEPTEPSPRPSDPPPPIPLAERKIPKEKPAESEGIQTEAPEPPITRKIRLE